MGTQKSKVPPDIFPHYVLACWHPWSHSVFKEWLLQCGAPQTAAPCTQSSCDCTKRWIRALRPQTPFRAVSTRISDVACCLLVAIVPRSFLSCIKSAVPPLVDSDERAPASCQFPTQLRSAEMRVSNEGNALPMTSRLPGHHLCSSLLREEDGVMKRPSTWSLAEVVISNCSGTTFNSLRSTSPVQQWLFP